MVVLDERGENVRGEVRRDIAVDRVHFQEYSVGRGWWFLLHVCPFERNLFLILFY